MDRRKFLLVSALFATRYGTATAARTKSPKTVKIHLVPPIGIHGHDPAAVVERIKRGFGYWSDVSNVVFEFVDRKENYKVLTTEIYLGYTGGIFMHGRGSYDKKRKQILVHNGFVGRFHGNNPRFNQSPYWVSPFPNPVSISTCVAHEFGHALGLDHSADPLAVMNSNITAEKLSVSEIKFAVKKFGAKS